MSVNNTEKPISELKGIGPSRTELFGKLGLFTLSDVLNYLPRDYIDGTRIRKTSELSDGETAFLHLKVVKEPTVSRIRKGLSIVNVRCEDETGSINACFFNQPYRKTAFCTGQEAYFYGRFSLKGKRLAVQSVYADKPGIMPVYSVCRGINQRLIRDVIASAWEKIGGSLTETLPKSLRMKYALPEINFCMENIHFPTSVEAMGEARRRLAFERLLNYFLRLRLYSDRLKRSNGIRFDTEGLYEEFSALMPFELTRAQKRTMRELEADMQKALPMNRLIQGDVGSGKTAAALYCMFIAVKNGCQAVLMAPTEILAEQHYTQLKRLFGDKACLITGSMKKAERDDALLRVRDGRAMAIAGTHALFQKGVEYKRLGAVIADEQHRFGVAQRAAIAQKGGEHDASTGGRLTPDTLIMSATPIPRTLSLFLYGDLDLSVIDELPPGRKPVRTHIVPESRRDDMYGFVENAARRGEQTYVVCPLIDEDGESSDLRSVTEVFEELSKKLSVGVGLLHGQMKKADRDEVIERFRCGELSVLVSTTVIEVGVDVKNAAVMVIEAAERFGLAQLHQLRGRIGRGDKQSYCFLLGKNPEQNERLNTLVKTADGFEIAKKDLEMRGPGEFFGERQHGASDLALLREYADMRTLKQAYEAADVVADAANTSECAADANEYAADSNEYAFIMRRAEKEFEESSMRLTLN